MSDEGARRSAARLVVPGGCHYTIEHSRTFAVWFFSLGSGHYGTGEWMEADELAPGDVGYSRLRVLDLGD